MISVKVEMPNLEDVCVIKLVGDDEEHLAMRVKDEHGAVIWFNDLHDVVFPDNDVESWKYFFPN